MATEPKTLTPPPAILGAFGLWLVSTALGVVTAILVLTEKDTLVAGIKAAGGSLSDAQVDSAATVAITMLVVVAIVFAALYLWLAFKLKAGRNWARVTLAVLTVLHLVTLFLQGAVTLSYVDTVIQVAAVVLSFLPASNAYVAARRLNP
ncbi:hypothetical protein ACFFS4_25040 [Kutzneria kofuensis]|uniref:Heme/copper-type cytochrome/quinol oxidase subunit 2 n=1 Tax=Kutzneria kofuensis TaxID=103725 RepID=A0A7W9KQC2_9PSEU|nr:hypothetical protein [Kutzneria kofuensis]MBB5896029.1 heme/copper-type cytochrome/quinol oxidase subunit 2 [Kutzneria kofuensis]